MMIASALLLVEDLIESGKISVSASMVSLEPNLITSSAYFGALGV